MRVASYVLIVLVGVFLLNAGATLVFPPYRTVLQHTKSVITGQKTEAQQTEEGVAEWKWLVESLDRLDQGLRTIANNTGSSAPVAVVAGSGGTASGQVTVPLPVAPAPREIPVSGVLLAKIMPDITLKKIENSGIFNIVIFTRIEYSTYQDEKKRIKVYAFDEDYETILSNMKLTSNVYSINETDQFFGYTFFLNPIKKDTTVRFVTSLEGHAIGIETSKSYYPTLKKMLSK